MREQTAYSCHVDQKTTQLAQLTKLDIGLGGTSLFPRSYPSSSPVSSVQRVRHPTIQRLADEPQQG
eukprot:753839-Hanusia_phi.AAC.3